MSIVPISTPKKPFEAYHGDEPYVFASYSHEDREAVYIELVRLMKSGFNIWYDDGLSSGSRWSDELAERIANCSVFVYFVTPKSAASINCQDEANFVLQADKPFLAVHLGPTELPPGLQLRMGSRQAILRHELDSATYQRRLFEAIARHVVVDLKQGFLFAGNTVEPLLGDVTAPNDECHHLEPKVMDVFVMLAKHADELVSRQELLDAVWPGQYAADELLTRAISELRRVLSSGDRGSSHIETVPKRGYRLLGKVTVREHGIGGHVSIDPAPDDAGEATYPERAPATNKTPFISRPYSVLATAMILALLALVLVLDVLPVPRPPVVADYRQLTTSRITLPPTPSRLPIVADASRLYFNDWETGRLGILQLSQGGGDASRIIIPFERENMLASPVAMTPDKSRLLLAAFTPGSGATPELWSWPIVGGNPRWLGDGVDATFSPDGTRILYANDDDEIFLARPNLSDKELVVKSPATVYWPKFSPDGSRIRFTAAAEVQAIYEVASDGSGLHRMLPEWEGIDHCCGSWTPDGRYFVFHAVRDLRTRLWAIRERRGLFGRRRSEPVPITTGALEFRRATIAADGDSLFAIGWQLRGQVVEYDSAVGRFLPATELESLSAEWLAWSRDGQWLAYVSHPETQLWRSRADGTDRVQLTFPPLTIFEPVWSPDGQTLAFLGRALGESWNIYTIDKDGGAPRLVSELPVQLGAPTWSPDGKYIAFNEAGDDSVKVVEVESGALTATRATAELRWPRWSPYEQRHISGWTGRQLQLVNIESGEVRSLVNLDEYEGHFWASDGRHIYYSDPFFKGRDRSVYRINIDDPVPQRVASAGTTRMAWGVYGPWIGVTPLGKPILLEDQSIHHIYALDWPPR